jgi:hypothetical protein
MAKKRSGTKNAPSRGRKTGGRSGRKGAAKGGGRKTSRKGGAKARARKGGTSRKTAARKGGARKGAARKGGARKSSARKSTARRSARTSRPRSSMTRAGAGTEEATMTPMAESSMDMITPQATDADLLEDTDEDEM